MKINKEIDERCEVASDAVGKLLGVWLILVHLVLPSRWPLQIRLMSAWVISGRFALQRAMSALPPKADMRSDWDVRLGP